MVTSFHNNLSIPNGDHEMPQPLKVALHQPLQRSALRKGKANGKNQNLPFRTNLKVVSNQTKISQNSDSLKFTVSQYLNQNLNPEELMDMWQNLVELQSELQIQFSQTNYTTHQQNTTTLPNPLPLTAKVEDSFLQKLNAQLLPKIHESDLDVNKICGLLKMSKTNLFMKIKASTGLSICLYVRKLKLTKAKELLFTSDLNISEIAYSLGFNDPKYFTRVFSEEYGVSPREMRERG